MKSIKLKFPNALFLVIALFISTAISAQPPGGPQGPPPPPDEKQIEKMTDDLSEVLSLTEEQKGKVSELFLAHFKKIKEKQEKEKAAREASREEMEALKLNFEKEIKSLLTEEQQKQFDAYQKGKEARPQKGRGKRPRG